MFQILGFYLKLYYRSCMSPNARAISSAGANTRLLSIKHLAKAYCFDLFFSDQSKIHKILRTR